MSLTPQRERFAQLVASGKSQADAYREAYPKSQKWAPDSVYPKASALAAQAKVAARVAELRRPAIDAAQVTLLGHIAELDRLKELAIGCNQVSAAIKAEELRGKVAGLYVERSEHGKPGDFNDEAELNKRVRERQVKMGMASVVPLKAVK